jgi:FkbH-like protein
MMKCALLSNVNLESLGRRIERHEVYIPEGFGAWRQELTEFTSGTFSCTPSSIFLIIDGAQLVRHRPGLQAMIVELDEHFACIGRAAQHSPGIKFFISTIDVPAQALLPLKRERDERRIEQYWQDGIAGVSAAQANVYIFDLKELVEGCGRTAFYSNKRWYLGGLRFSTLGEKLIARELERILDAQRVARKKCLLLDLDNTLWGGVIGEDGVEGIQLSETGEGARYKDFQRRIKNLGEMGVILGIVSKNNEADAIEVFETHEHMVLRKGDFAAMRINWSPKSQNIAEIAQDLDISTDSLVLIDDNPVEREAIGIALPEVTVPQFPADTCELSSFLEQVYRDCFFTLESTEEDRKRTESYRANARRAAERSAVPSIEEFLVGLRTKIFLRRAGEEDLPRVAQLTQKTNQFNLTTRRYTQQELRELQSMSGADVFVASVVDKYGDNGKVVVSIVRKEAHDVARLDTFLMSCRVMGRFIEDQILDHLVKQMSADGISRLRVQFIPTNKNAPARAFVERLQGGRLVPTDTRDVQTWEFNIAKASPVTRTAYAELLTQHRNAEDVS